MLTSKAAEYIGVSLATLTNWKNQGKIKQHSKGFYSRDELDRYIKEGPRNEQAT